MSVRTKLLSNVVPIAAATTSTGLATTALAEPIAGLAAATATAIATTGAALLNGVGERLAKHALSATDAPRMLKNEFMRAEIQDRYSNHQSDARLNLLPDELYGVRETLQSYSGRAIVRVPLETESNHVRAEGYLAPGGALFIAEQVRNPETGELQGTNYYGGPKPTRDDIKKRRMAAENGNLWGSTESEAQAKRKASPPAPWADTTKPQTGKTEAAKAPEAPAPPSGPASATHPQ